MTTTYKLCKALITTQVANGTLDKEDMFQKLDVFLIGGRITQEEYTELVELMG